jgi:hypothetical protein
VVAKRAVRDFEVSQDPLPVADRWAAEQGYKVLEQTASHRRYRKGAGIMAGSRLVTLDVDHGRGHLEGWVGSNMAARLLSLFILPANITLESGGFKGALPRKLGRDEVNPLLATLGQAPLA